MKHSFVRRAVAVLVLVLVAFVVVRMAIGAITAVLWLVLLVALAIAALWAVSTLKSAKRGRAEKRSRGAAAAPAGTLPAAAPEDRVDAQMRQIQEQLREQGRL